MSDTDNTGTRDYAAMKLPELRKLAAERGLKGTSALRKGELIEALTTGSVPARKPLATAEEPVGDGAIGDASGAGRTVLGGDSPRRATRRAGRAAGSAAAADAAVDAAAPAGASDNPGDNPGENTGDTAGEGYESRSQARRARRNRARREAHADEAGTTSNGAPESGSGQDEAGERKSLRERSLAVVGDGADGVDRAGNSGQERRGRRRAERGAAQDASAQDTGFETAGNAETTGADTEGHADQDGQREDRTNRRNRRDRNDRNDRNGGNSNGNGGDRNNGGNNGGNNSDDNERGGRGRRGRRNRRNRDNRDGNNNGGNGDFQVREGDELQAVAGILEVVDNNVAFLRTTGYRAAASDVFVNNNLVRRLGLRSGDAVTGQVKVGGSTHTHGNGRNRRKYNQLVQVDTVNGADPQTAKDRPEFAKLTPLYPNQRLRLETDPKILTTRVIDLIMPIGKGQRALIVSPPKAGKTTILQNIANAISTNNPECYLMVVLVDERPEEVTDMQRSVKGEVIASTFDRPPAEHTAVAELAIERAKRLVEQGTDVVVLLDSITRLGRAYNNSSPASGRILSGGVDSNALYPPKRFLGAARNIENGGSLTIIATAMVETGSTGDTVIFEEFKGTGNAELKLDRAISERRIFPAVDVNPSGTRKDELLLVPEEARIMTKLRRILSGLDSFAAIDLLIKQLKKTKSNGEFLMQVASSAPMAADQEVEDYI
ncbi:transcription termination factor Rho [uncultured Corynebacterium sp.]|uniref:transcription termination factor Rho n=1 Tax=uncultured Corynebacterium sp. TaxID=159447 RepID=UPI0025FD1719|nr:transcription termination factor Rho [uncultured Corynebacterium sp.]